MRDYKARPCSKARKPSRHVPTPRFGRRRAALPKGFTPLAAPRRMTRARQKAPGAPGPAASGGGSQGPSRMVLAWRGLRRVSLRRVVFWGALTWLVAGLATGAVALWKAPLQRVLVTGNRVVPTETVLRLGGLEAGMRTSQVDPFETARRIAAHPRLTAVDVRRLYPGRVAIRVHERQPALRVRLDDGRTALIDPHGVVLDLLPTGSKPSPDLAALPLITGVRTTPTPSAVLEDPALDRARRALAAARRLGLAHGPPLAVAAGNPFLLGLGLPDGTRLILPPARIAQALRTFLRLRRDYPSAFTTDRTIDLTPLRPDGSGRIILRRH